MRKIVDLIAIDIRCVQTGGYRFVGRIKRRKRYITARGTVRRVYWITDSVCSVTGERWSFFPSGDPVPRLITAALRQKMADIGWTPPPPPPVSLQTCS